MATDQARGGNTEGVYQNNDASKQKHEDRIAAAKKANASGVKSSAMDGMGVNGNNENINGSNYASPATFLKNGHHLYDRQGGANGVTASDYDKITYVHEHSSPPLNPLAPPYQPGARGTQDYTELIYPRVEVPGAANYNQGSVQNNYMASSSTLRPTRVSPPNRTQHVFDCIRYTTPPKHTYHRYERQRPTAPRPIYHHLPSPSNRPCLMGSCAEYEQMSIGAFPVYEDPMLDPSFDAAAEGLEPVKETLLRVPHVLPILGGRRADQTSPEDKDEDGEDGGAGLGGSWFILK